MLAVRMRGQSGGPLDPLPSKEKRKAHPAQYTRLIEPHPAMPIILFTVALFRFVYQGEPAITCSLRKAGVEVDRRRAATPPIWPRLATLLNSSSSTIGGVTAPRAAMVTLRGRSLDKEAGVSAPPSRRAPADIRILAERPKIA